MKAFVLAVGLVVGSGGVASAQVLGLPVVNSGVPLGIAFGADVGFSNDAAGKGTAIGARGELGIGLLGVSAAVSRFAPDAGDGVTSVGASATLKLFGGPLIPFRVMLQGGIGRWTTGGSATTRFPLSLGFAATIPVPAFAIKPWIAPRIEVRRVKVAGDTDTSSKFGISGGIEVAMLNGFSFRAAYDRIIGGDATPGILSFGIGFAP